MADNPEMKVIIGADSSSLEKGLKDAAKSFKYLDSVVKEQTQITREFEAELVRLEAQLEKVSRSQNLAAKKYWGDRIKVQTDLIAEQNAALKQLKKDRTAAAAAERDYGNKISGVTDAVEGAVSKLTGLNLGVSETARGFKKAIAGARGFSAALISTGIGAAVVTVGLLIEHWDLLSETFSKAGRELKELNKEFAKIDRTESEYLGYLGLLDAELALAKKAGKDTKKLEEERQAFLQKTYNLEKDRNEKLKKVWKDARAAAEDAMGPRGAAIDSEEQAAIDKAQDDYLASLTKMTKIEAKLIEDREKIGSKNPFENLTKDTVAWYDAEVAMLEESQRMLSKNAQDWDAWAVKIQDAKNKAYVLQTGASPDKRPKMNLAETGVGLAQPFGLISPGEEPTTDPIQITEKISSAQVAVENSLAELGASADSLINGSIANTFMQLGDVIGNALATGGNVLKAVGSVLINALGSFLSEMGGMLIKYGTLAIAKGTLDVAIAAGGPVAIAAGAAAVKIGAALAIAGGAIGGLAKSGLFGGGSRSRSGDVAGGGSSGGGGRPAAVAGGGNFGSGGGTVVFEIAGTKLLGVLSNTINRNNNLGGSLSIVTN